MTPVEAAISQLGVQEATGNNDGVPAERYMRGDELAWCAGFVLWCLDQAKDARIAHDDKTHYRCRAVTGFMARAREVNRLRLVPYTPKGGDVIFFGNSARDVGQRGNHMGLVERVDTGATEVTVHTIEGNTSNKVARRSYRLSDPRIIGYATL